MYKVNRKWNLRMYKVIKAFGSLYSFSQASWRCSILKQATLFSPSMICSRTHISKLGLQTASCPLPLPPCHTDVGRGGCASVVGPHIGRTCPFCCSILPPSSVGQFRSLRPPSCDWNSLWKMASFGRWLLELMEPFVFADLFSSVKLARAGPEAELQPCPH